MSRGGPRHHRTRLFRQVCPGVRQLQRLSLESLRSRPRWPARSPVVRHCTHRALGPGSLKGDGCSANRTDLGPGSARGSQNRLLRPDLSFDRHESGEIPNGQTSGQIPKAIPLVDSHQRDCGAAEPYSMHPRPLLSVRVLWVARGLRERLVLGACIGHLGIDPQARSLLGLARCGESGCSLSQPEGSGAHEALARSAVV